jgi:hypothetical protein
MTNMVLPLVDEHKPKCYLCHEGFEDIEKLRDAWRCYRILDFFSLIDFNNF